MRETLGILLILTILYSIPLFQDRSNAQVLKNTQCSGIGRACGPACVSDGGMGCWTWNGPPIYSCISLGDGCDPNKVFVQCLGKHYSPSSCGGINCQTPALCCDQQGKLVGIRTANT